MTTPVVEDKVIVASELTPPPSSGARFSIGDVVDGRYRVIAPLATGGMGEVYKVEHIARMIGSAARAHDVLFSTRILKKTGLRIAA